MPCTSESMSCESSSPDEVNQSSRTVTDLKANLLTADSEVLSKDNNASKLVEKVTIFESLELNNEKEACEDIDTSTTDQPLINLSISSNLEAKMKEIKPSPMNLDIQNLLEQPGTSIRFEDLKMTEI